MNPTFFDKIQPALAVERLDAYRQDQAEPRVALARYLWNMALCESLYSPLQMVEIALRNALQRSLNHCLTLLRELRNRVFHHERIIHWRDLDTRHAAMLETVGWISTELRELAIVLDRFPAMRTAGIRPWLAKLQNHWPTP